MKRPSRQRRPPAHTKTPTLASLALAPRARQRAVQRERHSPPHRQVRRRSHAEGLRAPALRSGVHVEVSRPRAPTRRRSPRSICRRRRRRRRRRALLRRRGRGNHPPRGRRRGDVAMSAAGMTTLERDFADACMRKTGHEARRVGSELKTLCPVHGDTTPSLDFHEENGIIVATCRSRACAWELIRAAIDWKSKGRDTFGARDAWVGRPVRARFTYQDEDGHEIVEKIRFDDDRKPKCTFSKKLHGKKLPLYRLPDVLAAVQEGRPVYVAEGEHDADTLHSLGFCGTSAPYGAVTGSNVSGKWPPAYTEALAGADVVLLQDADEAGAASVSNVARLLAGRVKGLRIVP